MTAKQNGWPQRLEYLNPFAYDIAQHHEESREYFTRGYDVKAGDHGRILFIGDSVLQQYIDPISLALGFVPDEVDSVTRGGCVLLKGVDFEDIYADISCNGLREKLYALEKRYDYVVISQQWMSYQRAIRNAGAAENAGDYSYIMPFLGQTLAFWQGRAGHVIVLGVHPFVGHPGGALEVSPALSQKRYGAFLAAQRLEKIPYIESNKALIDGSVRTYENVSVVHPVDIFCDRVRVDQAPVCRLNDGTYSYFRDAQHLTKQGQALAEGYFSEIFQSL